MKTTRGYAEILLFTLFLFLLLISCKKENVGTLEGAWKMVSGSYVGPNIQVECNEEDRMCYKVISKDHFAVVQVCPANPDSMFFAAIGRYSFNGSTYIESYEATNVSFRIGTSMTFTSKFEEDQNLWILEAKDQDMELYEVWERVQ